MADITETAAPATSKNALAVPSFRALWLSSVTFYLVSNALRFVYGWVVLDGLDRGEWTQGFVVFMLGLPSFFLLVPSGVWADRLDPKRLLIASQLGMVVIMVLTGLALGQGSGSVPLLVVSTLAAGAVASLGGPVRSSLIPSLLSAEQLFSGIALNAIAITVSLVLGAVTARLFGDWFGFDGAFFYLAGLLLFGLFAIRGLRSPGPSSRGDKATMIQAMREGLSFVWHDHGIRTLFLLLTVSGLLMSPLMMVVSQAHIKGEIGRDAGDAAPMLAFMGAGIAISSLFIMKRGNMANKGVAFMRAMMGGCTMLVLMGRTTEYWQMLVLAFFMGLSGGFFINMNQGLIQANTPPAVMGRVMSLYTLVQAGMLPLGALVLSGLAAAIGTGNTMSIGGAIGLAIVIIVYRTSKSIRAVA